MTREDDDPIAAGADLGADSGSTGGRDPNVRWYTLGDRRAVQLAPAGGRLVARVVDGGLLCIVAVALLVLAGFVGDDWAPGVAVVSIGLCVVAVGVLYEGVLIAKRGHTIGKSVAGVAVRRTADRGIPGWRPAMLRMAMPAVAAAAPAVVSLWRWLAGFSESPSAGWSLLAILVAIACYLSSTWTRDRRGWHDKVARTVVVAVAGVCTAIAGMVFLSHLIDLVS